MNMEGAEKKLVAAACNLASLEHGTVAARGRPVWEARLKRKREEDTALAPTSWAACQAAGGSVSEWLRTNDDAVWYQCIREEVAAYPYKPN